MNVRPTSYPLFRLTVAFAAGIFLSDACLSGGDLWRVLAICIVLFVSLCAGCLFCRTSYAGRFLFGAGVLLLFAAWGAALFLLHREDVRYDWPEEASLYIGTLQDVPRSRAKTNLVTVQVEALRRDSSSIWVAVDREILLYYVADSAGSLLQCGDRICFHAQVIRPLSEKEVTGFDYGLYLERQGISGTAVAFSKRWAKLGESPFLFFRSPFVLRENILEIYRSWGLDESTFAVVAALTVGEKDELTPALKHTYSAAGASHVLALSGLHIGILGLLVSWLLFPLRRMRGGRWVISCCVLVFLWGFAFLSGLSPSVVRAVTMFSFYTVASVFSSDRFSGTSALTLTAACMLVYQPMYLFDISFQLSFSAVFSILLFCPLVERLYSPRSLLVRSVWKALSVSFSAQLGTLPFILYYFGTFPTYFLLSNLFIVPLAVCILFSALSALCLSGVPILGDCCIGVLRYATAGMNRMMEWVSGLSGSQITEVHYSFSQSVLLAVGLSACYAGFSKKSLRALGVALVSFNLLLAGFIYENRQTLPSYVCFSRGNVYAKSGRHLTLLESSHNLYRVNGQTIALFDDGRWRKKTSREILPVDIAYLCRGFRGEVDELRRIFSIRCLIFDSSLNAAYKSRLIRECKEWGIEYMDMAEKGACSVRL